MVNFACHPKFPSSLYHKHPSISSLPFPQKVPLHKPPAPLFSRSQKAVAWLTIAQMAKPLPLLVVMLVVASHPWCPVSTPPPGNAKGDITLSAPSLLSLVLFLKMHWTRNSLETHQKSPTHSCQICQTHEMKKSWKFHNVFETWLSSCSTAPGQIQSKTLTQSTKPSCHRVFFDCSSRCLKIGKPQRKIYNSH